MIAHGRWPTVHNVFVPDCGPYPKPMEKFEINTEALGPLTDDEFFHFCRTNDHLRIERDAQQNIIVMAPAGSYSGNRNFDIGTDFGIWNRKHRKGYCFDSSAGFKLPNGATRSPDVAFILKDRWEALSVDEQEKFAPICPDFVLELRSRTDSLADLQSKMQEYLSNGAAFGWLIDPYERRVYVYDTQQSVAVHDNFSQPLRGRYFMSDFEIVLANVLN